MTDSSSNEGGDASAPNAWRRSPDARVSRKTVLYVRACKDRASLAPAVDSKTSKTRVRSHSGDAHGRDGLGASKTFHELSN